MARSRSVPLVMFSPWSHLQEVEGPYKWAGGCPIAWARPPHPNLAPWHGELLGDSPAPRFPHQYRGCSCFVPARGTGPPLEQGLERCKKCMAAKFSPAGCLLEALGRPAPPPTAA